jgi:hypothetical protein
VSISIASRSMSSSVAAVGERAVRLTRDLDDQTDAGERRAQLVRHRGQQLALLGQLSFQPHRHVVERRRQHADLVDAVVSQRGAGREVPLPQLLRRPRQLVDRARDPPRDPPRRRPQQQRRESEQEHRPPRVRRQPRAPQVRRQQRRPHAEEDRRPEPVEEPAVKVRAVMQAHLVTDAASPARSALARFAEHAVPRKRRALGREVLVIRAYEAAVAVLPAMTVVPVVMPVEVAPAHTSSPTCACGWAPSPGAST